MGRLRILLAGLTAALVAMSVSAAGGVTLGAGVASAAPASSGQAQITEVAKLGERQLELSVYSPAMGRVVPVMVLLPADRSVPRGAYYLLDGNSGQTESTNWLSPDNGNAAAFFAGKNVNVILPVGGTGTLYTDWQEPHPTFGVVKWETFLAQELPPLIDKYLGTNGRNAVAGISSGAQGALMLAERHPSLFPGVAGFSGCYLTDGPVGEAYSNLVTINGGADATLMWGEPGGAVWRSHDVLANAGNLRNSTVYLSSGNGLPGPHETLETPNLANRVIVGGLLEAGSNACTDQLTSVLRGNGVNVVRSSQPSGEHYWPYWRDELARSWPTMEQVLR